jgi:hypothetical protein
MKRGFCADDYANVGPFEFHPYEAALLSAVEKLKRPSQTQQFPFCATLIVSCDKRVAKSGGDSEHPKCDRTAEVGVKK